MAEKSTRREQTVCEEIANSITHGIGAVLSVAALTILVLLAALKGDPWRIVSFSIYGAALVVLYLNSTLYHSFPWPRVKRFFRRLDHASIFLLIAGTYTPFALVCMQNVWGWVMFGIVWGLALFGILLKTFYMDRFEAFSVVLYVGMGWVAVLLAKPLMDAVPTQALIWMLAGGLSYTLGVVFYLWRRLPYHHTVWHGFVMGGSILHFFAILLFVLPDMS